MQISLELVVLIILAIDAIGANIFVWTDGKQWYKKHLRVFSRYFPAAKGWAVWYLVLVVWIAIMMVRSGLLVF